MVYGPSERQDGHIPMPISDQLWQSKAETPGYKKGLWTKKETVLPDHIL